MSFAVNTKDSKLNLVAISSSSPQKNQLSFDEATIGFGAFD